MAALVLLGGCLGATGDSTALSDRWLRVGEDLNTDINVYEGELPPNFADLINPGIEADSPDRVSLPVHPDGALLGSYHIRRSDGANLMWLIYDVDGPGGAVAEALDEQLDATPWQVVGGQGNEAINVVSFQNTQVTAVEGSAVVQENPSTDSFSLTVERDGEDVDLTVRRAAPVPQLSATYGPDLVVTGVEQGPAAVAGLQEGDRITGLNDTEVDSPESLDEALYGLLAAGERRSSVTYVVQVTPQGTPQASSFVAPGTPVELPGSFPARDVWGEFTTVDYVWGVQQGTRGFQAVLVSPESSNAVATRVRDDLAAAGWEIVSDSPMGFATELQIAHEGDGYVGQVQIDVFPEDQSFVQVLIQIQTGTPEGN
ncbi:MAG: PDZ domain-containing protein [Dehalococcoidia bacterium]